MNKNRGKKILALLLCASLGASAVATFGACDFLNPTNSSGKNPSTSADSSSSSIGDVNTPEKEEYTVTFNYNYSGAPTAATSKVEEGAAVQKPADPTRDGYTFAGWYTDAAGTAAFNFATAITANTQLYARWVDASVTLYNVTFNMNYAGAPEATKVSVEAGSKVADPNTEDQTFALSSTDAKHTYDFWKADFLGWYTDAACTQEYDFNAAVNGDVALYAKWSETTYTFEAELVNLTGITGFGYSISYNDTELIRYDDTSRNQNASSGLSVGYLYADGLGITFRIHSDKAVENVDLTARLSAEFRDVYIAPERTTVDDITYYGFLFLVNEESVEYDPIALEGAKRQLEPNQRPFDDHKIGKISLKEGWNEIVLYVANGEQFESTINAMAPMIDCLYLTTDATLTWEPVWTNLDNVRTNPDD